MMMASTFPVKISGKFASVSSGKLATFHYAAATEGSGPQLGGCLDLIPATPPVHRYCLSQARIKEEDCGRDSQRKTLSAYYVQGFNPSTEREDPAATVPAFRPSITKFEEIESVHMFDGCRLDSNSLLLALQLSQFT